jgi:hypothetical protein
VDRIDLQEIRCHVRFSGMIEYKKTRDDASQALIDLRTKMGKTQAAFAVEVLKTAVTTIARYETSHRPPGDVLIRLSDIAREHGFHELASKFRLFYLEDVLKVIGSQITMVPEEGSTPAHGYLTTFLSDELEVRLAQAFILIRARLKSPDSKVKRKAVSAVESFEKASREGENPAIGESMDAFRSVVMQKKGKTR